MYVKTESFDPSISKTYFIQSPNVLMVINLNSRMVVKLLTSFMKQKIGKNVSKHRISVKINSSPI